MNIDRTMMTNHSGKSIKFNKVIANILIRFSLGHSEVLHGTQRFKSRRQFFKLKLFHDVINGPFDFFRHE